MADSDIDARVKDGSKLALQAYTPGDNSPPGFRVWTDSNNLINQANSSGSGFSATVYVNDDPQNKQIIIAVAGTNDFKDVANWPTVVTGGGSSQFRDLLMVGQAVNSELTRAGSELQGYSVSTTGHSWGETGAQILSYTFNWKGTGFDGPGANNIVTSQNFQNLTSGMGIDVQGGGDFISCNTAGMSFWGGGIVGALGSDIPGTQSCRMELPNSSFSGALSALYTFSASNPVGLVINWATSKLVSGVSQHSMDGINSAIQNGKFTVEAPTQAPIPQSSTQDTNGYFTFTDDEGNILRTKVDANGKVVAGEDGKPVLELILNENEPQAKTTNVEILSSGIVSKIDILSTNSDGAGNQTVDTKNLNSEGEVQSEIYVTQTANGQVSATVSGVGAEVNLDNASVTLTAGAQAKITGENITFVGGAGSVVETSNGLKITHDDEGNPLVSVAGAPLPANMPTGGLRFVTGGADGQAIAGTLSALGQLTLNQPLMRIGNALQQLGRRRRCRRSAPERHHRHCAGQDGPFFAPDGVPANGGQLCAARASSNFE